MKRFIHSAALAALLIPAIGMTSEPATPKALQKARHDHYHELGDAFKVVRDQTRAGNPDLAAIKPAAKKVNDASMNQEQWFPAGTGPEAGKTRALPEIWTKPAEFKAAMKMFSDSAPKLYAAANANDVTGVKAAFADVGKSCKNCHDQFRGKDHD